ncbi:MAG: hypothetical protein PVI33_02560 [Candidatus Omnitrophota bacterium]|jgi:hypothetical protein
MKADKKMNTFRIHIVILVSCGWLLVNLCGCEALLKKFTRKPKEPEEKGAPLLVPEEYSLSDIPVEERYRQYFLFWKSWQDELINVLGSPASHKKRKDCIKEAIKNLEELAPFLFEEKLKELNIYLERLRELENDISRDVYGARLSAHKSQAEILKRNILRDFSYPAVKNHLR